MNDCCFRRWLREVAVATAAVCIVPAAAAPATCKLETVAQWPIHFEGAQPVVDGFINGRPVGVLVDTGAVTSLLSKSAAERLDLVTRATGQYIVGFGGSSRLYLTRVDELRIGETSMKSMRVRVGGERPFPGVDFVLGQDFLRNMDLELDYAAGVMRVLRPAECGDHSLAYWDSNALTLPMEDAVHVVVPITVNGVAARAMIDSGASTSVVRLAFGDRLGLKPGSPGVQSAGCSYGFGPATVHQWVARFDSISLAGEKIRNARVRMADFFSEPARNRQQPEDVILGGDFLRTHRVLISRKQGVVYFSYGGGLVFPGVPGLDCEDERVKGRSASEALQVYNHVIAADPGDTKALINRAVLEFAAKDWQGSLSDLDAVIRIEPGNAVALSLRSGVRAALEDYTGAIADTDAAIANGMITAGIYIYRAQLRRSAGDPEGAVADLDEALKLDPRHQAALRVQGRLLFDLGRFEAAENDFATVLALHPDAFDALWLYFARTHRALDGRETLEHAAQALKEDEWPGPVLRYLLGGIDGERLLSIASEEAKLRKGRECEAHFYMAERLVVSGKKGEAKPLLEAARDDCPRDYIEYSGALAELQRIQ